MDSSSLLSWLAAHLDFIIVVVALLWVVPFLKGFQHHAIPSLPPTSHWPGARFYCSIVAVAFTVLFVKSLVLAVERHSVLPHDGGHDWHAIGYVAAGYLWCTFWFGPQCLDSLPLAKDNPLLTDD